MTRLKIAARALPFVVVVAVTAVVAADDWPWPSPRVFGSTSGSHGLKIVPPPLPTLPGPQQASFSGKSHAVLFTPAADGTDKVTWKRELVNIPHRAMITDDGKYVVTFDTWGSVGYKHSLVIYGEQGKTVADFDLEKLLSPAEILDHVPMSVSSRWWLRGATVTFNDRNDELLLKLHWGKVLRLVLATGRPLDAD